MTQESNRKPEPLQPSFQKPTAEPEPSEPFQGPEQEPHPEGLERHVNAVRQEVPRGTIAAQLLGNYPYVGVDLERGIKALSCGRKPIQEAL